MSEGPEGTTVVSERPGERELITHRTPVYVVTRAFCWLWLKLVHRLEIHGREHVPRRGGVMIVANHASFLDIPIVSVSVSRHVCFVARESLTQSRFVAWQLAADGAVLIRRGTADRQALKDMLAHLKAEDCVAVFPEGTRSKDGKLGEFRAGALFAAKRARVPIVPAAITGAFEALPSGRSLPRPAKIRLRFGPPIDASREDAMDQARAAIEALQARDADRG